MAMMASSAFREDRSHFETDSPRGSFHSTDGAGIAHPETARTMETGHNVGRGREVTAANTTGAAAEGRTRDSASSIDDHVVEKTAPPVKLTRKQWAQAHCRRFWLWYLIAVIIGLAIILPIVFKLIVPAIVQAIVNAQSLPITAGTIFVLSPTQLQVSLNTSLNTRLPADIDPLTLFLYNPETQPFTPFLNLTLPPLHVNHYTDVKVTNQTVTVSNHTELVKWFEKVYDQPKVDINVRGDATVKLGALTSNPHLDKTIEIKSLNGLSGFGINELQLLLPADSEGHNLKGTVSLPNSGVLGLSLGDLTFNLFSGPLMIGRITVFDVLLLPGNNTKSFSGNIWLDVIISNFGTVLASQTQALNAGNIQIDAVGNSTIVNGQHIAYIEEVINNRRLIATVPVIKLLSDVLRGLIGGVGQGSITQILTTVFGNSTLLNKVIGHWNQSGGATPFKLNSTSSGNQTRGTTAAALKRAVLPGRDEMAWQLLKLGSKLKAM